MGTWGTGPFDNDQALDWAGELLDRGPSRLTETLRAVGRASPDGDIAHEDVEAALAAAEVVSAARGHAARGLPAEVKEWIHDQGFAPSSGLVRDAVLAGQRILELSTTNDSWIDQADRRAWRRKVRQLLVRLQKPARRGPKRAAGRHVNGAAAARTAALRKVRRGGELTDDDLEFAEHFPVVSKLRLRPGAVTDRGVAHLPKLQSLQATSLSGPGITDAAIEHVAALTKLGALSLRETTVSPAALARLCALPRLRSLTLSGDAIRDESLEAIAPLTQLDYLCLDETRVTDRGLQHLARFFALTILRLSGTPVRGVGLKHLARKNKLVAPCAELQ